MKRLSVLAMLLLASCHSDSASPKIAAGLPAAASEFYAAIRAADATAIRGLYPAWRESGVRDVDGNVPLSVAAKDGHLDIVELLGELGECPNRADATGFTPLMMALHWNHADIADFLLNAGAIPTNDAPLWGSALRIAVHQGRRPIISHLLRSGANVDFVGALNRDGKTPDELAPIDSCVIHLFRDGLIKEEPTICQPAKRQTSTFDEGGFLH